MIFIHRGKIKKNIKENTLKGFKLSVLKGYNLETDIHFNINNIPICYHDFSLNRLYKSKKKIKNLSNREITKYKILKLKNLIKIIKRKTKLLIEVKPQLNKNTSKSLYEQIKNNRNILVISFKEKNLIKMYKINKKLKLGLIIRSSKKLKFINSKINKNHINFFVFNKSYLNNKKINRINKKKYFYTIKNPLKYKSVNKKNLIIENILL